MNRLAALYMLVSTFCFVLMKVFVKLLPHLPVSELIVLRSTFSLVYCYILLRHQKVYPFPRGKGQRILYLRAALGCASLWLYFYVVQRVPLGAAYALEYLLPITLTLLSAWWLKEAMHRFQLLFFGLCLGGVLSMHGFDFRITWVDSVLGLLAMLLVSCTFIIIRYVRHKVHPLVVIISFPLVAIPVFLPLSIWQWVQPSLLDWGYIFLIGALTQGAQYYAVKATFLATNFSKITIVNYTGMLFALFFGFIFFDETYGWEAWIGMGLVILGVWLNYKHEMGEKKHTDKTRH